LKNKHSNWGLPDTSFHNLKYPIPKSCQKLQIAGEEFKLHNNSYESKESVPINLSLKEAPQANIIIRKFCLKNQYQMNDPFVGKGVRFSNSVVVMKMAFHYRRKIHQMVIHYLSPTSDDQSKQNQGQNL
jgi:hypothetical protein